MMDSEEATRRLDQLDTADLQILASLSSAPMWLMQWNRQPVASVFIVVKAYERLIGDLSGLEAEDGGLDLFELEEIIKQIIERRGGGDTAWRD